MEEEKAEEEDGEGSRADLCLHPQGHTRVHLASVHYLLQGVV